MYLQGPERLMLLCPIKQHGVRQQGAEWAEGDGGGAHPHLSLLLVQHAPHATIRIGELIVDTS